MRHLPTLLTLALLLLLAGCDRSTTITYSGTVKIDMADGGELSPVDPADPSDPADPADPSDPPPPATGFDAQTDGALLEGWNHQLDIAGPPDHVALGPLGFQFNGQPYIEGFLRQNSCYRWTAAVLAPADGEYEFAMKIKSGGSITFDGEVIWAQDREQDPTSFATGPAVPPFKRTLEKGKLYPIKATLVYQGLYHGLTLDWKRPDREAPEPISTAFLRPPVDWQSRLKEYEPPPPEPLAYVLAGPDYQSPDITIPPDGFWSKAIDAELVDPLSDRIIARMGDLRLHPVFGQGGVGIPFEIVPESTPKISVAFDYALESDPGPYPMPLKPLLESGGGDGHWIGKQGDWHYELFLVRFENGQWRAGSGAIWNATTGLRVPGWKPGWTSGDAAGLEILRGLLRYDEYERGEIQHAIRVSVPETRSAFVPPATHFTHPDDPAREADDLPPMGCRLRLKASVSEADFPEPLRPVIRGLKRHGMVVADNGGPFIGLCGTPDSRWRDDVLAALKMLNARNCEVVKMGAVVTEVP